MVLVATVAQAQWSSSSSEEDSPSAAVSSGSGSSSEENSANSASSYEASGPAQDTGRQAQHQHHHTHNKQKSSPHYRSKAKPADIKEAFRALQNPQQTPQSLAKYLPTAAPFITTDPQKLQATIQTVARHIATYNPNYEEYIKLRK